MYDGAWQIANPAGCAVAGPKTLRFSSRGNLDTPQIEMLPSGQWVGTHRDAPKPLPLVSTDAPPWHLGAATSKDGVLAPLLSIAEIETVKDCGVDDLAR